MKKVMVALMATGFLLACNLGSENAGDEHSKSLEEKHQDHKNKAVGLILNNGVKWKADSSTKINVGLLQDIVSNTGKKSLENYHETAGQLQEGLNKMIKECKMKGPDHDALHTWLEPLMESTKKLKKQTAADNAAVALSEIEKQLNIFPLYFE